MLLVQPVRAERRAQIPAVTHVDGNARFQSVTETEYPLYHRLISRFAAHTGVPLVVNTSFNLRGEPIVHRPAEAVADFLASDMDALFLDSLLPAAAGDHSAVGPWEPLNCRLVRRPIGSETAPSPACPARCRGGARAGCPREQDRSNPPPPVAPGPEGSPWRAGLRPPGCDRCGRAQAAVACSSLQAPSGRLAMAVPGQTTTELRLVVWLRCCGRRRHPDGGRSGRPATGRWPP